MLPATVGALTRTNQDKPCRVIDGYTMLVHRSNADGTTVYWRCSKYNSKHNKCGARGLSEGLQGDFTMTKKRTHLADVASPVKRERKEILKAAAAANRATPSGSIASDAHEGLSPELLKAMPSQRNLQQVVNRKRKIQGAPLADKPPEELVIPEELKNTIRGESFLLADSRTSEPEEPPVFVFASDAGLKLLRDNLNWCLDATFYCAPKFFDSMMTVGAIVDKSVLPGAFILLPDKRQATYTRALRLLASAPQLQDVEPISYVSDMELAILNSMAEIWPTAEERLCHFHMQKALWTNIQKKRLLDLYEDSDVRSLLRCFGALALLPSNEVVHGFNEVCSELKKLIPAKIPESSRQALNNFTKYFVSTYVGSVANGRLVRPRYSINAWNCFQRTLEGGPRTNNAIEGWHAHVNSLFPRGDMPLTQFIVRLQKEEEKIRNLAVRHDVNPGEGVRGRPSEASVREKHLRAFVNNYANTPPENRAAGRLTYLRHVQLHLSPTAFARLLSEREKENAEPGSSQSSQHNSQVELPTGTQASQGSDSAQPSSSRATFSGAFSAFSFDD